MNVHFIAIGGAAMHNLALALQFKGYRVSGSDDEINEPSRSRLQKAGILPDAIGWFPDKIHQGLDAVIVGMHARADNPELLKARELGLSIYSYPEYLYEQSKSKRRFVVGGSHGKTTITAMVLHVLRNAGHHFDYMVGSQLEGFERMVHLSEDAGDIILEGDEYLSSPIDRRPKFHLYQAEIALISGIAWDHVNVFPTFENYVDQFRIFIEQIPEDGTLIYCAEDEVLSELAVSAGKVKSRISYAVPDYKIINGTTLLLTSNGEVPLQIFGQHNLMNLEGARIMCNIAGVKDEDFYHAISGFKGAARRLELVKREDNKVVYRDFAHSPSKLKATISAVREQFAGWKLIACMELHTFSSLSAGFLSEYMGSMDAADVPIVYFNKHTIEHKKLEPITEEQVRAAFGNADVNVFSDPSQLQQKINDETQDKTVILMMSSGTFDGLQLNEL